MSGIREYKEAAVFVPPLQSQVLASLPLRIWISLLPLHLCAVAHRNKQIMTDSISIFDYGPAIPVRKSKSSGSKQRSF